MAEHTLSLFEEPSEKPNWPLVNRCSSFNLNSFNLNSFNATELDFSKNRLFSIFAFYVWHHELLSKLEVLTKGKSELLTQNKG